VAFVTIKEGCSRRECLIYFDIEKAIKLQEEIYGQTIHNMILK